MDKRVIIPTIGRVMLFVPPAADDGITRKDATQPCRADVLFVNEDGTVNLAVTDHIGARSVFPNVLVVQPDDAKPEDGPYAHWMKFQAGQAPASEAVLSDIAELRKRVGDLEVRSTR